MDVPTDRVNRNATSSDARYILMCMKHSFFSVLHIYVGKLYMEIIIKCSGKSRIVKYVVCVPDNRTQAQYY